MDARPWLLTNQYGVLNNATVDVGTEAYLVVPCGLRQTLCHFLHFLRQLLVAFSGVPQQLGQVDLVWEKTNPVSLSI